MKTAEIVQMPTFEIAKNVKHAAMQRNEAIKKAEEARVLSGKFNPIKGLEKLEVSK